MKKLLLIILCLLGPNVWACEEEYEEDTLPVVYEEYDTVVLSHEHNDRLYFFRKGNPKPIGERIVQDCMLMYESNDGFYIVWNDYGNCDRFIKFHTLAVIKGPLVLVDNDGGLWWAQGRIMTDLKQP